jgi:hypothetical protein
MGLHDSRGTRQQGNMDGNQLNPWSNGNARDRMDKPGRFRSQHFNYHLDRHIMPIQA